MLDFGTIETREILTAFREGQSGWAVLVYQLNLKKAGHPSLVLDGSFGPQTTLATKHFQRDHFLIPIDGIAGPSTCRALCMRLTVHAQSTWDPPRGLALGVIEGESGFDPACVSRVYANGTRDIGGWQDNTVDWADDAELARSFDLDVQADATLSKVRRRHDAYVSWGCANSVAWKLATLYHNRETDADLLARASIRLGEINWSFISAAPGWFTIGGHSYSQREWDQKYVADKTRYITEWTA